MARVVAEDPPMPNASSMPSYRTSRRWTQEDALAALAALEISGLSLRAFAAREGLDVQRLYVWRRKVERSDGGRGTQTIPPPFVEVRASRTERVEIVLRSGRILRCAEEISSSALRRFIEVLEGEQQC
jgi:transposase-like protein